VLILDAPEVALTPLDQPPVLLSHLYAADRDRFARSHDHYAFWTLLALERGMVRVKLGDTPWEEISAGAWVVCPPHVEFAREARQTPFSFHFVRFEWALDANAIFLMAGKHSTRRLDRLNQNLEDWRALAGFTSQGAHLWREHLLWDVLALSWTGPHQRMERKPARSPMMLRARMLIEKNVEVGLSLADIAAQLDLSPVALTRQFRAAFGLTPSQFLMSHRLERARRLLISTDWPLDTIAARCGLGSGFYLSRVWSKQFGQSPSRFRRENQI
jgi:AraC family transcriptional regulator